MREALKLALEAFEYIENNYMSLPAPATKTITAIKEALAQQEQEPVAWVSKRDLFQMIHAKVSNVVVCEKDRVHTEPLYTNPPQRKPLTDEEIDHAAGLRGCYSASLGEWSFSPKELIDFARAIEAAHGIKE